MWILNGTAYSDIYYLSFEGIQSVVEFLPVLDWEPSFEGEYRVVFAVKHDSRTLSVSRSHTTQRRLAGEQTGCATYRFLLIRVQVNLVLQELLHVHCREVLKN